MSLKTSVLENLVEIDSSSLVDKVEQRIIVFIQDNKLKVGDLLPKELDLSERLGVSRTVVREALLRLRTIGLIESKKHKGAVLSNPDVLGSLRRVFHPSLLDESVLKDMFEMRLALEVGMADFIVNKITDADLKELKAIASDMSADEKEQVWRIESEIRFHGKLYEISQNKILIELQEMLLPIFTYVHQSGMLKKSKLSSEHVTHAELVKILKKRDVEAYRKAIRKHLENHFARILNIVD